MVFPADRTMALGSIQPLVKITRNIPWGKGGRCVRVTTSLPLSAECHANLEAKTSWIPLGHTGLLRDSFKFYDTSFEEYKLRMSSSGKFHYSSFKQK
jgi:hypothetical protein